MKNFENYEERKKLHTRQKIQKCCQQNFCFKRFRSFFKKALGKKTRKIIFFVLLFVNLVQHDKRLSFTDADKNSRAIYNKTTIIFSRSLSSSHDYELSFHFLSCSRVRSIIFYEFSLVKQKRLLV